MRQPRRLLTQPFDPKRQNGIEADTALLRHSGWVKPTGLGNQPMSGVRRERTLLRLQIPDLQALSPRSDPKRKQIGRLHVRQNGWLHRKGAVRAWRAPSRACSPWSATRRGRAHQRGHLAPDVWTGTRGPPPILNPTPSVTHPVWADEHVRFSDKGAPHAAIRRPGVGSSPPRSSAWSRHRRPRPAAPMRVRQQAFSPAFRNTVIAASVCSAEGGCVASSV
jgi:hypothetical protein